MLCFGVLSFSTHGQVTATWTGKANDSLWTSSKNWDTRAVPGSNDTAIIDLAGSNLVILNTNLLIGTIELGGQGANILQLTGVTIECAGSISISNNGVLEITGSSVVLGSLLRNSGTIMVPANLGTQSLTLMCNFNNFGVLDAETNSVFSLVETNSSSFFLFAGTSFTGSGAVQLTGNGYINPTAEFGTAEMTVSGTVELANSGILGNSTWTGPGLFRWLSGTISNVSFAPSFNVEVDGSNPRSVAGVCTNQGTLHWLAGSIGFIGSTSSTNGSTFYNSGTVEFDGDCEIDGGGFYSAFQNLGRITVPAGAGVVSFAINSGFLNSGAIDVGTNSTLQILTSATGAPQKLSSGTSFNGLGTVLFPPGTEMPTEGSIGVNATVEFEGTTFGYYGNTILTGGGLLRWLNGTLMDTSFNSNLNVEVDATFSLIGNCTNLGTIHFFGGKINDYSSPGSISTTFYNAGLFELETNCELDGYLEVISMPLGFLNTGTIKVPANLGELLFTNNYCNFTNYGTVDVESNSILDVVMSDPAVFQSGTVFAGSGAVDFPPSGAGVLWNGSITVNDSLELDAYCLPGSSTFWSGSGLLSIFNGALYNSTFASNFNVQIDGTLSVDGNCTNLGTIRFFGGDINDYFSSVGPTFCNAGLFELETNCELDGFSGFISTFLNFLNAGTIKVPANLGELSLSDGYYCDFTNYGIIDVETNSILDVVTPYSPAFTAFQSGTVFDGPGTVELDSGADCTGQITANGSVVLNGVGQNDVSWTGAGLLQVVGDGAMNTVTFGTNFQVEIFGTDNLSLYGSCTNLGCVRVLGSDLVEDSTALKTSFYNVGLFQIETNLTLQGLQNIYPTNSPAFINTGRLRVPANLGELSLINYNCYFTNSGVIEIETNSILDVATLSAAFTAFQSGTVFGGPGTVELDSGAGCTGQITANGGLVLNGVGQNNVNWTGTGVLQVLGGGAMNTVTFGTNFQVEIFGTDNLSLYGSCTNFGCVRMLGSDLVEDSTAIKTSFYNVGLFQIETNLTLQGLQNSYPANSPAFINTGRLRVPANLGELSLINYLCYFTNYGVIDVETNSILDITTPYPPTTVAFESGSDFSGPGTLTAIGYVYCDGTITVNGTFEYDSAGTPETGSTFWTGPGSLHWTGGGLPTVTFAPGFNVQISGADPKYLTVCTNEGAVRWPGGESLNFLTTGQFYNSGLVQIEADGTWNNTPIKNEPSGIFRQLAGNFSIASLTNCGTVDLQSGELNVATNFFSGSNSIYQITLNGTTPGTNYNQLTAQTLALNGSLKVVLTNGFSPVSGNSFVIANDSSQSGTFSNLTVPTFQSNLVMNIRYSPGSVLLEVDATIFGLTNSVYTNGAFQFSLNGSPASAYDIQASTNLLDWITIGSNSPFTGSLNFMDTNAASWDRRYYRARIYP